jgi:hypothetical protein
VPAHLVPFVVLVRKDERDVVFEDLFPGLDPECDRVVGLELGRKSTIRPSAYGKGWPWTH